MDRLIENIKNTGKGIIQQVFPTMSLKIFLLNSDLFGFSFSKLFFLIPGPVNVDLPAKAEEIERRVTYLNERLKIIEIQDENRVIMKSTDPYKKGDAVIYYDLFLENSGQTLKLRFYRKKNSNGTNTSIPSLFSYDQLERLVSDLAEIFA